MSIRAILAMLILGSSTITLAQPAERDRRDDDRWEHRDRDRDRRGNENRGETRLLGPTRLARELAVNTKNQLGGLSTLRIEPSGTGRTHVDRVVLTYSDRGPREIRVERSLDANDQPVQVGLGDAKDVTRVTVYGHGDRGATIAIDAM